MTCNCNNEYIKRVIGVTRTFNWTVTTGGEDVSLEGRNLTLQLMEPRGGVVDLPFSTTGDVVSFTWQGDDQTKIGLYSLILWENYGEDAQRRVDIHNFVELIPWSDNEQGAYSDLTEETITLETSDFGADVIVEDNLTSTSTSNALSANMGRVLNITKQDVIADLATIRSGAAAGAAVKEWAKNDVIITDDGTQATASKLSFNGNLFEQWISGVASSVTLKGIAGFLKLADISQWSSAYNDRMIPTVAAVKSKIDAVANALATIEAVIPSQASSSNKLTDKAYVDGAIATNTANFVGTFDTLAELQAVQNPTKNDYGFVVEQDAQGNEYYDRYKYTGSQWLFEYKVESTPFTAEQWAAIQSGITAALVSKLSALPTNAELNTALAGKQPVINDLPTIRSGAAAGATAYQKPSGGIPASDMASAVQTSLGKADSAYQKPSSGIPASDMASAVQTSLGKADSAYQKPSGGIPKTDLASGVQASLDKADAAAPQSTTYTKTEVDAALATKQTSSQIATINGSDITHGGNVSIVAAEGQTITIDAAPTAGSNNAVSSGGVYNFGLEISERYGTYEYCPEYISVVLDGDGRLLEGITSDGKRVINLPLVCPTIETIEEKITGIKLKRNKLHYDSLEGQESYIISPFNAAYDIKFYFTVKRAQVFLTSNSCLNFGRVSLVNKTTQEETVVHNCNDDIAPVLFNGTYIGANHGCDDLRKCLCTGHDKTVEDIGSVWSCDGHNYTIVGVSGNYIYLLGENTATYPIFRMREAPIGSYTHVSGATHVSSFTATTSELQQMRNQTRVFNVDLILDGSEINESGDYVFDTLEISEAYDIINQADSLAEIQRLVGTFAENPIFTELDNVNAAARYTSTYTFKGADFWALAITLTALQDIQLDYFGFTQQSPLAGESLSMYIPKALPISNGAGIIDFREIVPYNSVPSTMNLTSDYWENPLLPPDRWIQYSENIGLASGFIFDFGVGGTARKDNILNAFYLYTSRKCYPHGIDTKISMPQGTTKSAVVFRKYLDVATLNHNGIIASNIFEYAGKLYLYADFNAAGVYDIALPPKHLGRKITVFEKSNNVTLLNELSANPITIKVESSAPMYGYIVASIN